MTTKREADRHFQKKSQGKNIVGNAQRKVPVNKSGVFRDGDLVPGELGLGLCRNFLMRLCNCPRLP